LGGPAFSILAGPPSGALKLMRVIGILVHPSWRSKFHGRLLLLWRDVRGLRCVLISPGRRSKFSSRFLLHLLSAGLIHLLLYWDADGLRRGLNFPGSAE